MTLYDIDSALLSLVDPETGELMDYDAFAALQIERTDKLEGVALWYKSEVAQSAAIKAEEDALRERRQSHERKAERLKAFLAESLMGEKFETAKCAVSFRKTSSVRIDDADALVHWAESNGHDSVIKYKSPDVSKTEVGKLMKSGVFVPFAEIVDGLSLAVK